MCKISATKGRSCVTKQEASGMNLGMCRENNIEIKHIVKKSGNKQGEYLMKQKRYLFTSNK